MRRGRAWCSRPKAARPPPVVGVGAVASREALWRRCGSCGVAARASGCASSAATGPVAGAIGSHLAAAVRFHAAARPAWWRPVGVVSRSTGASARCGVLGGAARRPDGVERFGIARGRLCGRFCGGVGAGGGGRGAAPLPVAAPTRASALCPCLLCVDRRRGPPAGRTVGPVSVSGAVRLWRVIARASWVPALSQASAGVAVAGYSSRRRSPARSGLERRWGDGGAVAAVLALLGAHRRRSTRRSNASTAPPPPVCGVRLCAGIERCRGCTFGPAQPARRDVGPIRARPPPEAFRAAAASCRVSACRFGVFAGRRRRCGRSRLEALPRRRSRPSCVRPRRAAVSEAGRSTLKSAGAFLGIPAAAGCRRSTLKSAAGLQGLGCCPKNAFWAWISIVKSLPAHFSVVSAGAVGTPIRLDLKILKRPSSGAAAPAWRSSAASRPESGRNYFFVDSRPSASRSPSGCAPSSLAPARSGGAPPRAPTRRVARSPVRLGLRCLTCQRPRRRPARWRAVHDSVAVVSSGAPYAGCRRRRRGDASRSLRARRRGDASRSLRARRRGSGIPTAGRKNLII